MYLLHLASAPHGITRYLSDASTILDAYRFARSGGLPGIMTRVTRIEWAPEAYVDHQAIRIHLEDVLVATTRFRWACRRVEVKGSKRVGRKPRSKSAAAVADLEAHRTELGRHQAWLWAAGGEQLLDEAARKLARSIARDRLRHDAQLGCLCGAAACGRRIPAEDHERERRRIYRTAGLSVPPATSREAA